MPTNRFQKNELVYAGSVKNIFSTAVSSNLIFEFTDDYSVFDWGKMPDAIPQKGEALAKLMSVLFERLEARGVKTHYRGFDGEKSILVDKIGVYRPERITESGHNFYTYPKNMQKPYLIPLEVVFRFEVCAGSSFIKRHPEQNYHVGQKFEKPYIEMFTKLEDKDRPLSNDEALQISGLTRGQFEEIQWRTSEVAQILQTWLANKNIRLMDGKIEWGLSADNEIILVDAIGPDEMRLEKANLQLSKEILREYYRKTDWYQEIEEAKVLAESKGYADWKSLVKTSTPVLPVRLKELVSHMYLALVNEIADEEIFPCEKLDSVIQEMLAYLSGSQQ